MSHSACMKPRDDVSTLVLLSRSFRDDESGECLLKQGAVFFQPGRQLEVRAELFHRFVYGKTRGIGRNLEEGASRLVEVDGMEVFTINDGSDVSLSFARSGAGATVPAAHR